MISLQSFAVLVHEAFCSSTDECVYINTSTDESYNEYESFREILMDLKYLQLNTQVTQSTPIHIFTLTNAGLELLAAHNICLLEENYA